MSDDGPVTAELDVTSVSHDGEGIGRLDDGRVVFVAGALPGERVRVSLPEAGKPPLRATLAEMLAPSHRRVEPRCRHYGRCGGCHLQHASYEAQLAMKRQLVTDQLRRLGKFDDAAALVRPVIGMVNPWAYRNQARFSIADTRAGFRRRDSSVVEVIEECPVLVPRLQEAVAGGLQVAGTAGEVTLRASASTGMAQAVPQDAVPGFAVDDLFEEELLGRRFRVSPGSFFQVNTARESRELPQAINGEARDGEWSIAELLVLLVLDRLPQGRLGTVVDAYSGVGTFTAFLAKRAETVVGIESSEPAMKDAHHNTHRLRNIKYRLAPVERTLPSLAGPIDAVVLDPPRAGLHGRVTEALVRLESPRVVYVSCDPATLARDARRLVDGGFTLDCVEPLDMFPQTSHIECVATFSR